MRGALLIATVLVATAWAGCLGGSDEDATPADDGPAAAPDALGAADDAMVAPLENETAPPPYPPTMVYSGCTEQVGLFPYPAQAFESAVPAGFTLVTNDPAQATVFLASVAMDCTETYVNGAPAGPVTDFTGFVAVEPPPELALPGAAFHLVTIGAVVSNAQVLAAWTAWGFSSIFPTTSSDYQVTDGGAVRAGSVAGESDGFRVEMRTAVSGQATATTPGTVRIFASADGIATGYVDNAFPAGSTMGNGAAVLTFSLTVPPFPPPASPGLALHFWGEGYGSAFTYTPLDPQAQEV